MVSSGTFVSQQIRRAILGTVENHHPMHVVSPASFRWSLEDRMFDELSRNAAYVTMSHSYNLTSAIGDVY